MSLVLLAPASLSDLVAESRLPMHLPHLEALAAAGRIARIDASAESWLCAQLGVEDESTPVAALRLASETPDGGEARSGYWLCADPIAATAGINSVRIDGVPDDLTMQQAQALCASLSAFFAQDGLQMVAAAASRWYVRANAAQRIATVPLWRATGRSMLDHLAIGADAPVWRTRLNEAQMLMHEHPVNREREASGLAPVAGVWWWGGGAWPAFGAAAVDRVIGGPRWIAAACAANRIAWLANDAEPASMLSSAGERTLAIIGDEWGRSATAPDVLAQWDARHFAPLRTALEAGVLDRATLLLPWDAGLLRIDIDAARRRPWQRWFGGGRTAPAPSLSVSLKGFVR